MARHSRPWYWQARDGWYVTIDGRRHLLAKGKDSKADALKRFHKLKADDSTSRRFVTSPRIGEVCNLYVSHASKNLAPLTAEFYRRHLTSFAKHAGRVQVTEAAPKLVTSWLDKHPGWGQSTRSQAITAVKRAFRWAKKEGHTPSNPFVELERPGVLARSTILTAEQVATIRAAIPVGDSFGDFLDFMAGTGARPSEAMRAEASHFSAADALLAMPGKTTGRTGRLRVIHLPPAVAIRLAELVKRHPTGPLLRMGNGKPWNRNAMATRFRRLREKLGYGPEATAESYRHKFATDLLAADVPIATTAELLGHASTIMVSKHYSKLSARHEHLRAARAKLDQVPSPHVSGPQMTNGAADARDRDEGSGDSASFAEGTTQDPR